MAKEIEVRASEKYKEVPTPYGRITQKRFIKVLDCTYIRNRIRDGELEKKILPQRRKERKGKALKKSI